MESIANRDPESVYRPFPFGLYMLGALGVLSGDWLALHLYGLLTDEHGRNADSGWLMLLCAPVALFLGWLLGHLHHRFVRNRTPGQSALYYLCAFGLVTVAGWLAASSEQWLRRGPLEFAKYPWPFGFVVAAVLGVAWFGHSRLREEVEHIEDIQPHSVGRSNGTDPLQFEQKEITVNTELASRCRALIVFVSTPNIVPKVNGFVQDTDPPLIEPELPTPIAVPLAAKCGHFEIKEIARDPKDSKECKLAGGWKNLGACLKKGFFTARRGWRSRFPQKKRMRMR